MKGFIKFLLIVFTVVLVLTTTISKTINRVIASSIIESKITNKIVETITDNFKELNQSLLSELTERITNNDQIEVITKIYVDSMLNDIINDTVSNVDITPQIDKIIEDNINDIPLAFQNLVIQKVKNIDFNNIYISLLSYVKNNIGSEIITFFKIYSFVTSKLFLFSLIGSISLMILIMYLITKIKLDFFYDIGMCSLISGGFLLFMTFTLKIITSQLALSTIGVPVGATIPSLGFISLGLMIVGYMTIDICNKYQDKLENK